MPINFLRRPGGGVPGALAAAVGTAAVGICLGLIDDFDLRVLYRDPGSGTTLAAPLARQH